jgi:hypothetical protein
MSNSMNIKRRMCALGICRYTSESLRHNHQHLPEKMWITNPVSFLVHNNSRYTHLALQSLITLKSRIMWFTQGSSVYKHSRLPKNQMQSSAVLKPITPMEKWMCGNFGLTKHSTIIHWVSRISMSKADLTCI